MGEELCGYYGGETVRGGLFGQYTVVIVHVPGGGTYSVSGVAAIDAVDSSGIQQGHPVRIIWQGWKHIPKTDRNMKQYEVFVAEDDAVPVDPMPEVEP